ncbi:MAG TPA: carboxylesterase/lipase family protein [Ktedonobacterales bacterium]|jgi:para-nitrobenzyl esterase|nr:carboxylesterase/lipase family protein [Ktedonobacterales bacterium]
MNTVVANPVVKTRAGAMRGAVANGVSVFKGIPYAAPPVGANRLLPPQPVAPWSGVRDAFAFGPTPPKPPIPPQITAMLPEQTIPGDDCLNLNIWSADLGARQPVMVWIPGGMFEYGTAATAWYDGSRFARDGVVCVTINYRVGAEGFLYLGEGNANRGLLDQIAALEWVRENIAAFGGDPDNVTIFGESAGAMSVGMLLAMPRAEGLFHRAIAQSGAASHSMSVATAVRVRAILAEKTGIEPTHEAFAAVPTDRLMMAQAELKADLVSNPNPERWGAEVVTALLPWQPVIDRDTIPAPPLDRITTGAGAGIDLLIGTNTDEHRLFLASTGALDQITDESLAAVVAAYGLPVEETLAAYRTAHPSASPGDLLAAIQTDWYWRIPAIRLADAHAKNSSATWMYEFAWRSPQFGGLLGACHSLEITFVFDTLGCETEPLLGPDPPQQLASAMHAAWVAFATTGDPGWPRYDLSRRSTMRFDTTLEVVNDPLLRERALWEGMRN